MTSLTNLKDVKTRLSCTNAEGNAVYQINQNRPKNIDKPTLKVQSSGVWIYVTEGGERLVPIEETLVFTEQKQVKQALNDVYAKAYFGCKVWEAELTAKPMPGTGFMNYITPEGREVFFPMSWCFSECPPAFFLVSEKSSKEIGVDFSYVNIYTSLAESNNTGLVDSYFRIYSDEDPREDVTQKAQLVVYVDERATVTPDTVTPDTTGLKLTISSLTTQPSDSEKYGLSNQVPPKVGFFDLESGQIMCRDEDKWELKAARQQHRHADEQEIAQNMLIRLCGLLPPSFVPVESCFLKSHKQGLTLAEFKCDPPSADPAEPEELFKIDLDGNPILQPRSYTIQLDQQLEQY